MTQRCRCCLTTNADIYFDIFGQYKPGTTYAENIRYLAEVQVEHNDGLPQHICSICCNEFRHIYEFGKTIRQADERLRQELLVPEKSNTEEDDVQMENVQVLDNEYFSSVDENVMQVCVIEEILEHETEQEDVIVEEIQEVEEINIMEELLDVDKESKENLLVGLAQVASTQENVNITENADVSNEVFFPENELDDNYLIEFNENEEYSHKQPKWKCGECKLILRGDVSYEGHMNIHKQIKPHQCSECQTKFRCRSALKRHKELRHSHSLQKIDITKPAYSCAECNNSFLSSSIYKLHEIIIHEKGEKCPFECNFTNNICDNLKEHVMKIHANQLDSLTKIFYNEDALTIYQCYKCSETFEKQSLLEYHMQMCEFIEEHLQEDIISLENDAKKPQSEDIYQCKICRRKLLKKNINKHMELHKRKENKEQQETNKFLCAFCPREFKNSKSLHQHEKIHQGERADIVYVCGDCDRQYASEYLLETHRKHAHKERDNICNICGNAFKMKNQLMNHMKLHLEKNIPCPHCDKKYARHFDLNVHLRSHTGEMPYGCHICDKRFAIKVRLTYHLQKHYGIKHYCKECGAEFNSKQKLKAHSFKHTGMPYRCELCDDHGFATRNTFKRHLDRVHHASISEEALNEMFQQNTGKTVKIRQINHESLVQTNSEDDNENTQEEIEVLGK